MFECKLCSLKTEQNKVQKQSAGDRIGASALMCSFMKYLQASNDGQNDNVVMMSVWFLLSSGNRAFQ